MENAEDESHVSMNHKSGISAFIKSRAGKIVFTLFFASLWIAVIMFALVFFTFLDYILSSDLKDNFLSDAKFGYVLLFAIPSSILMGLFSVKKIADGTYFHSQFYTVIFSTMFGINVAVANLCTGGVDYSVFLLLRAVVFGGFAFLVSFLVAYLISRKKPAS